MVWSWFRWFKSNIFVDTISPEPMPASGEVEVLRPTTFVHQQTLPDRRKIELKLDFSSLGSPQRVAPEECYHIRKKCKLESMSLGSAFSSSKKSCLTARTMSPHELASKLSKSKPVLVLDCRPFLAYNRHHIQGAVNVSCADKISRKRLEQGKLNIADFISSTEAKDVFKKRTQIVIYDEHTTDLKEVSLDNGLNFVLSVLLREGKEAFVLKGGLKDFSTKHNDLCMSSLKDLNKNTDVCPSSARCPGFSRPLYSPTGQPIHEPDAEIEHAITSQILPFLYLGNERDAASLDCLMNNKISYVLNVTSHVPLHFEKNGIKYKRLPANDSCQQNLKQYFEEAIEFIDDCHQNGGKILIHCHAGVSRSATITIAYILKHTKMTMTDAYKYVKGKRAIISPNFNFMGQLMEFERDLNKGETPRILNPRLQGVESTV